MKCDIFYKSHTCVWSEIYSNFTSSLNKQIDDQVEYSPQFNVHSGIRRQIFEAKAWEDIISGVNAKQQIIQYFKKGTCL